jgi:Fe-S-cluster-containing dehydrogenase component/CRP-like cAMP-binding protein
MAPTPEPPGAEGGARAEARREEWPAAVFDAPVLRGLDARARREIAEAGTLRRLAEGAALYRAGEDAGESFFVVASGRVALRAVRRGDAGETELRAAGPSESFGEESTVGMARRSTAVALTRTRIAEIPVHVFRRAAARSGKAEIADRLERALRRSATSDLLGTLSFTRDLSPRDLDVLLDAVTHHRVARGHVVYRQGDAAGELWLVADGMVQLQTEEGERLRVHAYLGRGDFFGDGEILDRTSRTTGAVASGASVLLSVPAAVFRSLEAAHPALATGMRRVAEDQHEGQQAIVGRAAANATQHVFRDLYRLQVARSLLVIDLESCVRCGHCAWACSEMYGVARLVRRGDKVVARVEDGEAGKGTATDDGGPRSLLLPSSCQHCENPACMVDCPTGAIGRDPSGEVFIRPELCTGCGACAKACPWDNIQMAVRPLAALRPSGAPGEFGELAVKCDLCRSFEGPACVQACPTESIFRVNPAEEIAGVRELLRGASGGATSGGARSRLGSRGGRPAFVAGAAIAAVAVGAVGATMQARAVLRPGSGIGFAAGLGAGAGMLLLLAYAAPKRGVRWWMRRRRKSPGEGGEHRDPPAVTSVVRPQLTAHLVIGLLTLALALVHAPWPPVTAVSLGGALATALLATSVLGGWVALAYWVVPPRLSRLERTAALPEDFAAARKTLLDRLFREVSGKSELVKKIFERLLLPYAKSPLGPARLLLSGRRLREEEEAVRARIDKVLEGRGAERLSGLRELVRLVVELRALPAQRWLLRALRAGLPLHVITFCVAVVMLGLHVAFALARAR